MFELRVCSTLPLNEEKAKILHRIVLKNNNQSEKYHFLPIKLNVYIPLNSIFVQIL